MSRLAAQRSTRAALAGLALLVALPAAAQRLILGRWQATIAGVVATLTVITADGDGWVHGTLAYDPPLDDFAGAPFTSQIVTGGFTIEFVNGTRYDDMHWCAATLCGTYRTLDGTATPVGFTRRQEN